MEKGTSMYHLKKKCRKTTLTEKMIKIVKAVYSSTVC